MLNISNESLKKGWLYNVYKWMDVSNTYCNNPSGLRGQNWEQNLDRIICLRFGFDKRENIALRRNLSLGNRKKN